MLDKKNELSDEELEKVTGGRNMPTAEEISRVDKNGGITVEIDISLQHTASILEGEKTINNNE